MRGLSSRFWLSAQQLAIPAHELAKAVPALGAPMARLFKRASLPTSTKVVGLDLHSVGGSGVAVRIKLTPGAGGRAYKLTPEVGALRGASPCQGTAAGS